MDYYYVIYFGEDSTGIKKYTKENLEYELNNEGIENISMETLKKINSGQMFFSEDSEDCYKNLIIKGEIIIPKQVEIITKYEI